MKNLTLGTVFQVNLQEGFITDQHNSIIAAYNYHQKSVVMKHPENSNSYNWTGTTFEHYTFINGVSDSFGISGYTNDGDKPLGELILKALAG